MNIVDLEKRAAVENLHKKPFSVRHKLADHPLFELSKLVELAQTLPRDFIEFNDADLEPGSTPENRCTLDKEPDEIIRTIGDKDSCAWIALKRVDTIPEYQELLKDFINDLFTAAGMQGQKYSDLQGFIFIASAHSTTPFHADAEENVLAHIKGDKDFYIYDNEDRSLLSEKDLEIAPSNYRNRPYDPSYEEKGELFKLVPGDGLHVPYMMPHWVRTGESYTISMQMTWKTPEVVRMNKIRLMNGTLRRFGMPQKPPGISPSWDKTKIVLHDAAMLVLNPLRKAEPVRRLLRRLIYGKNANYFYDSGKA
jgi:hypothetical protein